MDAHAIPRAREAGEHRPRPPAARPSSLVRGAGRVDVLPVKRAAQAPLASTNAAVVPLSAPGPQTQAGGGDLSVLYG